MLGWVGLVSRVFFWWETLVSPSRRSRSSSFIVFGAGGAVAVALPFPRRVVIGKRNGRRSNRCPPPLAGEGAPRVDAIFIDTCSALVSAYDFPLEVKVPLPSIAEIMLIDFLFEKTPCFQTCTLPMRCGRDLLRKTYQTASRHARRSPLRQEV